MLKLKSGIKTTAFVLTIILSAGVFFSCDRQEDDNSLSDSSSETDSDKKFVSAEKKRRRFPELYAGETASPPVLEEMQCHIRNLFKAVLMRA